MRGILFCVLLLPELAVAETMDFRQAQKYAHFNDPLILAAYHTYDGNYQ